MLLCSGALFIGGCATQEAVSKDEALTPATVAQQKQVKENPVTSQTGGTPVTAQHIQPATQPVRAKTEAATTNVVQLHNALEKIYFDFDAATLSEQARTTLSKNVEMMKSNPAVNVRIEGNCDEHGSSEYNLALGEKRAKSAKQYMATLGIPEKRLSVISYGKEKPAYTGHDEAAWSRNRRDEFVIISK